MKYRHVLVAGPRSEFDAFCSDLLSRTEYPRTVKQDRPRGILTIGCVRYLSVTHREHARGYDTKHTTKVVLHSADKALREAVTRYDSEQVTT